MDGRVTLKPATHLLTRSPPTKKNLLYQEDLVLPCYMAMPNKNIYIYLLVLFRTLCVLSSLLRGNAGMITFIKGSQDFSCLRVRSPGVLYGICYYNIVPYCMVRHLMSQCNPMKSRACVG